MDFPVRKLRISRINYLYRYLLVPFSLDNFAQQLLDDDWPLAFITPFCGFMQHITLYCDYYEQFLKSDWEFKRLNYLHQAILLNGCFEMVALQLEKAIIINEALNLAKLYTNANNIAYLNKVLDEALIISKLTILQQKISA